MNNFNESVKKLHEVGNNRNDEEAIKKPVNKIHSRYHALEAIFD
ncbi:MAG: hypothetical protein R6V04_06045 [bacterium]